MSWGYEYGLALAEETPAQREASARWEKVLIGICLVVAVPIIVTLYMTS